MSLQDNDHHHYIHCGRCRYRELVRLCPDWHDDNDAHGAIAEDATATRQTSRKTPRRPS